MSISKILLIVLVTATTGEWWYVQRHAEGYSVANDLREAKRYLALICEAERKCLHMNGSYVSLPELGGCGGLDANIVSGMFDGFRFEVEAAGTKYGVRVHPTATTRLISLYSNENGTIYIGTRNEPATPASTPLDK